MAAGNTNKHGIGASTDQDSCKILQGLADVYINPEDSISVDAESACLVNDLNSETPNKYPNAPHSSPIDLQNDPYNFVFNEELVKCLNELPVILLSVDERTKNGYAEMIKVDTEDQSRNNYEASNSTESGYGKEFPYHREKGGKNCSVKVTTVKGTDHLIEDGKNDTTELFSRDVSQFERYNLLRVDSYGEFSTDFSRKTTLSDNASLIVNFASDASDVSFDVESVSSDDNSSSASRDRIEFEALALDSAIRPSIVQKIQHWRTRGRNKRALSLDEMIPSKMLHLSDFSATPFELTF